MSSDLVELTLERFFRTLEISPAETRVLVAFSGGPDSTALLAGLVRVAPHLGIEVVAGHFDHGLDPDSGRRARQAARLAGALGVPVVVGRRPARVPGGDRGGKHSPPGGKRSPEASARRARYEFLAHLAAEIEASFVATAHHVDDQAETVLLRLVFGSGIEGLAGIRPVRRLGGVRLVRPLLGLGRRALADSLGSSAAAAVADPTNDDLAVPRNRFRRLLVPYLERDSPGLVRRLGRLASAAARAADRLDEVLAERLDPRPVPYEPGVQVDRAAFESLPEVLRPHALALLHRRAGVPYPAAAEARDELARQLGTNRGGRVGCDCGAGWRWEAASGVLQLVRRESKRVEFAYNVRAPGEVEIPELGLVFRLRWGRVAPWMFEVWPDRAGLADFSSASGSGEGRRIEVRNRRRGDRMTPLGRHHRQRLKDLFIDRRVPRRLRDRLPLLVVDGEIAWVPGVTIAERFRIDPGEKGRPPREGSGGEALVWAAEIESSPPGNGRRRETCSPWYGAKASRISTKNQQEKGWEP